MSEVSVKFTAEDAALWKALQRVVGASQKVGESIEGAGTKGRAATAEMERFAKRLTEINSTPAERYERAVERMSQAIGVAGFTQEMFNKAVEREKQVLDQATASAAAQPPEVARANEELRRFAARTKELNATPIEKYKATVERMSQAIGVAGFTQEDFNRAVEREQALLDKATAATDTKVEAEKRLNDELDQIAARVKNAFDEPWDGYAADVDLTTHAFERQKITAEELELELLRMAQQLDQDAVSAESARQSVKGTEQGVEQLADAARKVRNKALDELRASAARLRAEFDSGKISAAEYGRRMQDLSRQYSETRRQVVLGTEATWDHGAALSKVTALLGGLGVAATVWKGIHLVIRAANDALEKHSQLVAEARGEQLSLAAQQQELLKNISNRTTAEKRDILLRVIPEIQERSGFPEETKLVEAYSHLASAGIDDQTSAAALETAAKLNLHTPDKVASTALALGGVSRAVGTTDTDMVAGFVTSAQQESQISNPESAAKSLQKIIEAGKAAAPDQDVESVAEEAAAIQGMFTKLLGDTTGERSATAFTTTAVETRQFFKETAELQRSGTEKERAGKKPSEEESRAMTLGPIEDPGGLLSRMEYFQKNPDAREVLLGRTGIGGNESKLQIETLLSDTQAAKDLRQSRERIDFSPAPARQIIEESRTITPHMALAAEVAGQRAELQNTLRMAQTGIEGFGEVDVGKVLEQTRPAGLIDATFSTISEWIGQKGKSLLPPEQQPELAKKLLAVRLTELADDAGVKERILRTDTAPERVQKIDKLDISDTKKRKMLQVAGAMTSLEKLIEGARQPPPAQPRPQPVTVLPGAWNQAEPIVEPRAAPNAIANEPPLVARALPRAHELGLPSEPRPTAAPPPAVSREIPRQPAKNVPLPVAVQQPPLQIPRIQPAVPAEDLEFPFAQYRFDHVKSDRIRPVPQGAAPAATAAPLPAVSRETREQHRLSLQASQSLLDAATALAAAAAQLKASPPQLAVRSPPPLPNFSGRARREQAHAVG